jgi:hypothetical protein
MSVEPVNTEGDNQEDDDAQDLAATRILGVGAHELALVFGRQGLGTGLCVFGIAFAGFAIGLRDANPGPFDLPILLTIFGFATLLTILGVFAAILRKEGEETQQALQAPGKDKPAHAETLPAPGELSAPGAAQTLAEQALKPEESPAMNP